MQSKLNHLSTLYSSELKELVRLVVDDASLLDIEESRERLSSLSNRWSATHWKTYADMLKALPSDDLAGVADTRIEAYRYVFTREQARYECACTPSEDADCSWTIRRDGCEVDGPRCSGDEFSTPTDKETFEALAIAAVASCRKPCAIEMA